MRWKALWLVVGVTLLLVGSGAAEAKNFNHLLRGDYAFSGEATCLVSIVTGLNPQGQPIGGGGFNTNLTPFGPPAPFPFLISFSIQGVRTFNGDGTGSVAARIVSISHPFAVPAQTQQQSPFANLGTPFFNRGGASSGDIQSTFTYEVAPELTFTVQTPVVSGTFDSGTRAGQMVTITNIPVFSGRISSDHHTLTLAHEDPVVEAHTFSNGDVHQEICHRSRILLELKGGN